MWKTTFLLIPLLVSLAGCVTQDYGPSIAERNAQFTATLNSWVGDTEEALVAKWGGPNKEYSTANAKFLTYLSSFQKTVPGYDPAYMQQNIGGNRYSIPIGGAPSQTFQFSCEVTWVIKNGRVDSWNAQGNGCI